MAFVAVEIVLRSGMGVEFSRLATLRRLHIDISFGAKQLPTNRFLDERKCLSHFTGIGFSGLSTELECRQLILLGVYTCVRLFQGPRRLLQSLVCGNDEVALRLENVSGLIDKFERCCPSVLWAH